MVIAWMSVVGVVNRQIYGYMLIRIYFIVEMVIVLDGIGIWYFDGVHFWIYFLIFHKLVRCLIYCCIAYTLITWLTVNNRRIWLRFHDRTKGILIDSFCLKGWEFR